MSSRHTNYTHAIVCRIPDSYKELCQNRSGEIDLAEARKQHEEYVCILRDQLNIDVIEMPPDENYPDSVFVEDIAVICNGQALICRPGHPTRAGEVEMIRNTIKKELELPLIEIRNPNATIDGGDVLFTGREFFVGISSRTNEAGALAVANAFPDYPVTPIKLNKNALHLKECMTMGGPDIIIVSQDKDAQEIVKRVAREATFSYSTVTVPDRKVSNCIYANGTLIYPAGFPESVKQLDEKLSCPKVAIRYSELQKGAGCLTCCSLLIKKSKYNRKL